MRSHLHKHSILATVAIGALVVSLAGCAAAQQADSGSGDTLVIADTATPVAVDPTAYTGEPMLEAIYNVYTPLLEFTDTEIQDGVSGDNIKASEEEGLQGALAESWERTGQTTLRFTLRKGVKSPAGNELTSEDVLYTVNRHLALNLVGAQTLAQGRIISATAIDDYTFDLETSVPSSVAPFIATQPQGLGIIDSTEAKKHATTEDEWSQEWLKLNTAGFGPYQLAQAQPGQKFTFTANPNYYGEAPGFSTVEWREVASPSDRASLLRAGDIDIAQSIPPQLRKDLRNAEGVQVIDVDDEWSMLTIGLTPNTQRPHLDDPKVRQAIAYLLPNEQIINNVMDGEGDIRKSWIASSFLANPGKFWTYDENVDKAKALLAEAGVPDGFKTSITFDASQQPHEQIASLLVAALGRAGIEVTLNKASASTYSDDLASRDFDIMMTYGGPLAPNAAYELHLWYNSENFINSGSYNNPEIDALIDKTVSAGSQEEYLAYLEEADEILARDVPRIGLVNTGDHYQMRDDLDGFRWRANTQHYDWSTLSR